MTPPNPTKPTALAVEDYLKRTAHAKHSVKLTTVDALGRTGSIVIYQGELWSAQDTQGSGELALLRLMNERTTLREEPLSELDRGPRNITERRHVLFLRASFEAPAALAPEDDPPTSIMLPKPLRDARTSWSPERPLRDERASWSPERPLRGERASWSPELPTVEPNAERPTRSPLTLQPLFLEPAVSPSPRVLNDASHTPSSPPATPSSSSSAQQKRTWQRVLQVALVVGAGSTVGVLAAWPSGPSVEPVQVNSVSASDIAVAARPKAPTGAPTLDVTHAPVEVQSTPAIEQRPSNEPPPSNETVVSAPPEPRNVTAHVRAVYSSASLGGISLRRYVYSVTGQFMRCYDWAAERAGRQALSKVSVTVRVDDHGQVASSAAAGGKLQGLNRCIADVAGRLPALMRVPPKANTLGWVVAFEEE